MSGRMQFEFEFTRPKREQAGWSEPNEPMRIVVMGDFSGCGNRMADKPATTLSTRPIMPVDVDNFENVLRRCSPRLSLPLGEPGTPAIELAFQELEDFHPDELYQKLDVFQALRQARQRLLDPATFEEAAAELRSAGEPASNDDAPSPDDSAVAAPSPEASPEDDAALLDRLLGERPAGRPAAETAAQGPDLTDFIRQIVEPHIVSLPKTHPQQQELVASVDAAAAALMRSILHHPDFQALESAWRSVYWLIRRLELGEELKLSLVDVTKEELTADVIETGDDLRASALHTLLIDRSAEVAGEPSWSLIVGHYAFGTGADDVALLKAVGEVAPRAGGPFLAEAEPNVLGCRCLSQTPDPADWAKRDAEAEDRWSSLRKDPVASWIGLALPRFLLRLPYGAATDEIEAFEFEELASLDENHDAYLWGNPAVGCAMLIATAFQTRGWSLQPGDCLDLDSLPVHTFKVAGESRMKPCAEVLLGTRAVDSILSDGLMPLLSYKNRDAVRVARFQSIADPPAALSGRWR